LINKTRNHLYNYILFAAITAGILSTATWLILNEASDKLFSMNYGKRAEAICNDITTIVKSENLTYYQAIETIDISQYYEENLRLVSSNEEKDSNNHKRINSPSNDIVYMFPINYSDVSGEILIKPMIGMLVPNYCEFIIALISAFIFMSTLFFFVRKSIRYIEEIDRSIDIIAGGKLTYKIPVRGNDELSRLAANINEMSGLLKERMDVEKKADIKQRQLITNISHDLRTPLTVLTGYLDLLENHNYENQEEANDFIYCASQKCSQLQKLIEELFTYNKLTNGDVPIFIEKVDIIRFVQKNISEQGLTINIESKEKDAIVSIDRNIMNRILDNLFDNIRKYGISNEAATVYIKKIDHKVMLIVENSTNQDLSDKVDNLFERMYVGDESRTDKSSGLGLSIVAESVRLMNGTISARFQKPILQIIIEFNEG
jgi:signal transduction histidine kinase